MDTYRNTSIKKLPPFCEEPDDIASAEFYDQPKDLSIKRKAVDLFVCAVIQDIVLNSVYKRSRMEKSNPYPESSMWNENEESFDMNWENIHLRGINSSSNSYSNGFKPFNQMTGGWNSFGQPSATSTFTDAMTPPTSPNSYSFEPKAEDLSVKIENQPTSVNSHFECDKEYTTLTRLSKHQQYNCPAAKCNQERKQHACEECGKSYPTIGALNMHSKTHTLPCKCHICGKGFPHQWQLQGHVRTHTGEKPFSCTDCKRSFADSSNLRAHQQIHAEVRKFVCKVCNKSFARMSLLNKHSNGNCTS